jgi:heat shock protein HslJ
MVKRLVPTLVMLVLTLAMLPQVLQGGSALSLVGTVWQWQQTHMSDDTIITANDPGRYQIEFLSDGRVNIKADCNTVLGTYQTTGDQLTITLGPSTLVGCPPDSQADIFLQQLSNVNAYLFAGDALILNIQFDAGGMRFAALQNASLTGTAWKAQAITIRGGFSTLINGTEITIQFGTDGKVSGSSGCNRFTGSYEATDDQLTFGPLATTRMACAQDIMDQEQGFLNALAATTTYRIVGTTLTLYDATGARTAGFVAP